LNAKKKNPFNGNVYVLTGGNSFSATTLFVNAVKGLPKVTVIGEETGGGAYGNTAWLIPTIKLPATGLRVRLPLFRLVQDSNRPKTGHGIFPDIEVRPTLEDIKKGRDVKLEKALELIRQKNN
jgi:C-terminal processing protease CtpA/Prc